MPQEPPADKKKDDPTTVQRDEDTPEQPLRLRLQIIPSTIVLDLGSRNRVMVGRKDPDQEPDVDLTPYGGVEQGVGRQHALITLKQGRYYVEDLKSLNETLLNGSRLYPGQSYLLRNGDYLQFGALAVKVLL
jgi:FHA domain